MPDLDRRCMNRDSQQNLVQNKIWIIFSLRSLDTSLTNLWHPVHFNNILFVINWACFQYNHCCVAFTVKFKAPARPQAARSTVWPSSPSSLCFRSRTAPSPTVLQRSYSLRGSLIHGHGASSSGHWTPLHTTCVYCKQKRLMYRSVTQQNWKHRILNVQIKYNIIHKFKYRFSKTD